MRSASRRAGRLGRADPARRQGDVASAQEALPALARTFAASSGFEPLSGRHIVLPDDTGALGTVIFAREAPDARFTDPFSPGRLAACCRRAPIASNSRATPPARTAPRS